MTLRPDSTRLLRLQYLELLLWGVQLLQGKIESRQARLLRAFALERVRRCQAILAEAGVQPHQNRHQWAAFQDAERALVGFIDWAGRSQMPEQWEPLQTELYQNEKLGELVLAQMDALDATPLPTDYPLEALEVQARCLELGYCGHAAHRRMDQNQMAELRSKLTAALNRPFPGLASPFPALPQGSRWRPRVGPLGILGMALLLLALLGGFVRLSIYRGTSELGEQLKQKLPAYGCP